MNIYTSEKVMPYVYMGTHRVTGEFYIGSRANKKQSLPSHEDIYKYRTSSKRVKPIFDEFDWVIIAEFFDPADAFAVEQQLIHELWNNPLKLNGACHYNNTTLFSTIGVIPSDKTRRLMSEARLGKPVARLCKPLTDEHKQKISASLKGRTHTHYHPGNRSERTPEQIQRLTNSHAGLPLSDEHKQKIREALVGRKRPEDVVQKIKNARANRDPVTQDTRQKMSESHKGKKQTPEAIQRMLDTRRRNKVLSEALE